MTAIKKQNNHKEKLEADRILGSNTSSHSISFFAWCDSDICPCWHYTEISSQQTVLAEGNEKGLEGAGLTRDSIWQRLLLGSFSFFLCGFPTTQKPLFLSLLLHHVSSEHSPPPVPA